MSYAGKSTCRRRAAECFECRPLTNSAQDLSMRLVHRLGQAAPESRYSPASALGRKRVPELRHKLSSAPTPQTIKAIL